MKIILLAALTSLILVGCGKWQQDPLSGKPGFITNGVPNPISGEKPSNTGDGSIRLTYALNYIFQETKAGELKIEGRVFQENYSLSIVVANIADFPGARFNPSTGVFSWTPPSGLVKGGDLESFYLEIRAEGSKAGSPVLTRTEKVPVIVKKNFSSADVVSVVLPQSIREGEQATVEIEVRDDSATTNSSTWPQVQFGNITNTKSIAGLLKNGTTSALGNGLFKITANLDLTDLEMTESKDQFGFSVKALSQFGLSGIGKDASLSVLTRLSKTITTWTDSLDILVGSTVNYKFLVLDPKNEGKVSNFNFRGVPTGATVVCSPTKNLAVLSCVLYWVVPATQPITLNNTFTGIFETRNVDTSDIKVEQTALTFGFNLLQGTP
jgi:hypothetical protein